MVMKFYDKYVNKIKLYHISFIFLVGYIIQRKQMAIFDLEAARNKKETTQKEKKDMEVWDNEVRKWSDKVLFY